MKKILLGSVIIVATFFMVTVYLSKQKRTNTTISPLDYADRNSFHIDQSRPPLLCAKDAPHAETIFYNYIREENARTLTPPLSYKLSKTEWIKDRTENGYLLSEKININETGIYYKTADLRLFKCSLFEPGNPNWQTPQGVQTLGYYRGERGSVESMKKIIEYLFNRTGMSYANAKYEIENNVFTYRFSYSTREGDWNLEVSLQKESIYRINMETGTLTLETSSIRM